MATETAAVGLSTRDLLKQAYDMMKIEKDVREIAFPRNLHLEIANDSDGHRHRSGCFIYPAALLLQIEGKSWIVARGEKGGDYPGDRFDSDIIAFQIESAGADEEIATQIQNVFGSIGYFCKTLFMGNADGTMSLPKNCYCEQVKAALTPVYSGYIATQVEIDPDLVTGDLRPVVKKPMSYKPEFAGFLSRTAREILMHSAEAE